MKVLKSLLNLPVEGLAGTSWVLRDPTRPDAILAQAEAGYPEIEMAVRGSGAVFEDGFSRVEAAWSNIRKAREECSTLLSMEQGRTRSDIDREWAALERIVTAWFNESDYRNPKLNGWEARGCVAALLSSCWPLYHSVKFTFAAWIAGNPVILKPSEQASLTVHRIVEILRAAGKGSEAVQCLLGDRETGRRLACHEAVETVIFMGTFENGMRVRQDTLSRPAKEILLHLGNRNVTVFGKRVEDEAFSELIDDAFTGAGQDCKSVSILLLPENECEAVVERLHDLARSFKIGDPRDGAWMGPLHDPARLDRYLKFVGISEREGASVVMRGKPLPGPEKAWCVTPTLTLHRDLTPEALRKSVALQTEILAPMLSMIPYRDSDHLISMLSGLNHAHTCSLRGGALPEPYKIPFSRVLMDQAVLSADPAQTVHYRKRNGNHACSGVEAPRQLMRRILK
jgi:acyl-CoA reductase-like NAD-dependent aldehyde dehydrogenase